MDLNLNRNPLRSDEIRGTVSPVPSSIERRPGGLFSIALDVISVVLALGFAFGYRLFLSHALSVWMFGAVMLAFAAVSGLQALLMPQGRRRLLVLLGETAIMSACFYDADPQYLVAAAVLFFAFMTWGYLDTRHELDYATEVRFFANTKPVMGRFITAALLFMILIYLPSVGPGTSFVSEKTFSGFFNWSAGFVEKWYPGIPFAGTFGDFTDALVLRQLQANNAFKVLSPQNQSAAVAQNAQALISNFSQSFGFAVHASDTVSGVLYGFAEKTLAGWQDRFASTFLLGWSIVVFLILRSIGIVFMWASQLVLGGVYEILLAVGVIGIKEESVVKEVLTYQ